MSGQGKIIDFLVKIQLYLITENSVDRKWKKKEKRSLLKIST